MKCRHCNCDLRYRFLDLGSAPPSNAYRTLESLDHPETWYPLRLLVCTECWLVQTEDYTKREALFDESYAYFSAFSSSWLEHSHRYVVDMRSRFGLGPESCVVEVAANDGYLLQYVKAAGIPCYGIEPTASTAAAARAKGIEMIERFFSVNLAKELAASSRKADLITANNVLAHVPDINDFVSGFVHLLKPSGVATFEFPHLLRMVQGCQFDTAYHEHYSYLSLLAVQRIFAANGLTVIDVEQLPTHGGSLRVFASLSNADQTPHASALGAARIQQVLEDELAAGMLKVDFYTNFQCQALRIKRELIRFLLNCQSRGVRVGAYGAAAKGNTLLNFAGLRSDLLPYVVDKNPAKQGKFLPGSRIPILGETYLRTHQPDHILILPWNLREEIVAQLNYVREWGGKFVVAVPHLEVF